MVTEYKKWEGGGRGREWKKQKGGEKRRNIRKGEEEDME